MSDVEKEVRHAHYQIRLDVLKLKGLLRQAAELIPDNVPKVLRPAEATPEGREEIGIAIDLAARSAVDACRVLVRNVGEYRSSIESGLAKIEAMQLTAVTISESRLELLRVAAANAVVTTVALNRHREDVAVVQSPWKADGDDLECNVSFSGNTETPFLVTFEPGSALVLEFGLGPNLKKVKP